MLRHQRYAELIGAKRTTRTLYTEALVGRGDITPEEAQQVQAEYQAELESVFASVANHVPDHDPNFKAPVAPAAEAIAINFFPPTPIIFSIPSISNDPFLKVTSPSPCL